jgi:phosphocarrier protein FPr
MRSEVFTLHNPSGLHARPAATLVQLASTLTSSVTLENLDRPGASASGRSIIEVLTLGAGPGHRIRVVTEGPAEEADLATIASAIESGLGEGAAQSG